MEFTTQHLHNPAAVRFLLNLVAHAGEAFDGQRKELDEQRSDRMLLRVPYRALDSTSRDHEENVEVTITYFIESGRIRAERCSDSLDDSFDEKKPRKQMYKLDLAYLLFYRTGEVTEGDITWHNLQNIAHLLERFYKKREEEQLV